MLIRCTSNASVFLILQENILSERLFWGEKLDNFGVAFQDHFSDFRTPPVASESAATDKSFVIDSSALPAFAKARAIFERKKSSTKCISPRLKPNSSVERIDVGRRRWSEGGVAVHGERDRQGVVLAAKRRISDRVDDVKMTDPDVKIKEMETKTIETESKLRDIAMKMKDEVVKSLEVALKKKEHVREITNEMVKKNMELKAEVATKEIRRDSHKENYVMVTLTSPSQITEIKSSHAKIVKLRKTALSESLNSDKSQDGETEMSINSELKRMEHATQKNKNLSEDMSNEIVVIREKNSEGSRTEDSGVLSDNISSERMSSATTNTCTPSRVSATNSSSGVSTSSERTSSNMERDQRKQSEVHIKPENIDGENVTTDSSKHVMKEVKKTLLPAKSVLKSEIPVFVVTPEETKEEKREKRPNSLPPSSAPLQTSISPSAFKNFQEYHKAFKKTITDAQKAEEKENVVGEWRIVKPQFSPVATPKDKDKHPEESPTQEAVIIMPQFTSMHPQNR